MEGSSIQRLDRDGSSRIVAASADRSRWLLLLIACGGVLMIVLDATVVTVALPAIRTDLGFSSSSLVWVLNGYIVPYGGFLLLGGRLGDHWGHLRVFIAGIMLFTLASLGCGIALTGWMLVTGRVLQGVGGAAVSAVSLSLIMQKFDQPRERAKALAIFYCVDGGGSSAGLLLGGIVTHALGWRWVFLVNVPVGVIIFTVWRLSGLASIGGARKGALDAAGAVTITLGLMLAAIAILNAAASPAWSLYTWVPFTAAMLSGAIFLLIESRSTAPLVSRTLFQHPNISSGAICGALRNAAQCIWFFTSALYMQRVLGYDARQVGLAFLPATSIMAVLSLGLSARLVIHYGSRRTLVIGMLLVAVAMALLSRGRENATFIADVLPGMVLLGLGAGATYNPLMLSAMRAVRQSDYGVASGVITSAAMMAGALGLALAFGLAASRSDHLLAVGMPVKSALNSGYHVAFFVAASCALGASLTSLRIKE